MRTTLDVSVVICTYTEERWHDLTTAIRSVQNQITLPREIIVIVDHNPRLLARLRAEAPAVNAAENHEAPGASGARNTAIGLAKGEIIALLDDDAEAAPDWLEALVRAYRDSKVLGTGGLLIPKWATARPIWFPDEFLWVVGCSFKGLPEVAAPVRNPIGANMSFRRAAAQATGGFRNGFGCSRTGAASPGWRTFHPRAGDDETEFCIRIRQRWPWGTWLYQPDARAWHRVPPSRTTWSYFLQRCFDEGLGKAQITRFFGAGQSLGPERAFALRTLPEGIRRGLADALLGRDWAGGLRAGAIVAGSLATVAGYVTAMIYTGIAPLFSSEPRRTRRQEPSRGVE